MTPQERKNLSKYLSLVLRHEPGKIGLTLDEQGFVGLSELIAAMWRNPRGRKATEEEILEVVETSDKQRFEIVGNRIRARYGHSVSERLTHEEIEPPDLLYHGTSPQALSAIRKEGLRPMKRQYVHLSSEEEQARQVGRRHHPRPVVLRVRARDAWKAGVKFYRPEERLYLAEAVPPRYLETDGTNSTAEDESPHDF